MKRDIRSEDIRSFSDDFNSSVENVIAQNAVVQNGINNSAINHYSRINNLHQYSIEVEAGKITNQKSSGRCWMFASYNVMRLEVMKKLNLDNMELSQCYSMFYDKLEKANHFLENMIETIDEPLDGRVVSFLMMDPVGDGGQWDMFRSLTAKYGVVPKDIMPETFSATASRELNSYLTKLLRQFTRDLRDLHSAGKSEASLRDAKTEMMKTIYRVLAIALGEPPASFTWETRDKDGKFIRISDITPKDFYDRYVGLDLDEMVTVINAPTKDKPFNRTYTVQFLGNVKDGKYPVKYLNLPMDDLRDLTIRQLKDGKVVWFGSDVGQFSERKAGMLTRDALSVGTLLGTEFRMSKEERLDYHDSLMTHAMVITGVDLDEEGRSLKWKVENSWGDEVGDKGFFVMDDAWFGEFAYQILLEKKYLSEEQKKAFDSEPVVLKPWDPMGSLA